MRAHMHCGFLDETEYHGEFAPTPMTGYPHNEPTCPGYTCALPDVADVAVAYMHWDKGDVRLATSGREPCRPLSDGLIVLSQAVNALNGHVAKGDKP